MKGNEYATMKNNKPTGALNRNRIEQRWDITINAMAYRTQSYM